MTEALNRISFGQRFGYVFERLAPAEPFPHTGADLDSIRNTTPVALSIQHRAARHLFVADHRLG